MQLSLCETITDEALFIESHLARIAIGGKVNDGFKERLRLYYKIKENR